LLVSLWDKFATLQRPQDAHAIDAYEALVKIGAERSGNDATVPTTQEIHAVTKNPELAVTVAGLKQLNDLELVRVVEWERLYGDYNAPGNRWVPRF